MANDADAPKSKQSRLIVEVPLDFATFMDSQALNREFAAMIGVPLAKDDDTQTDHKTSTPDGMP